ncbi:hypothetical protein N0V83_001306 [Neocucurbitaria cava]|uniref:Uncharacterized protein n=1 Tax=Neocucurbitaria cava TaxID=798079 RepID=A0A9W9CQB5_9PLEO|nr:hypothetical protein N0V83_001306 [Neocucurbitaria cava]
MGGLAILDFTTNVWQATIPWTMPVLTSLVKASSLRWLTSLELDLELFTDTSDEGMTQIVSLIKRNKMLKHLRLRAGINLDPHLRPPSKNWSPLLDLLGTDRPPFRLQTLDLDGLITSGTTTLDRIINIHAPTLRRIVLNHINLRRPNSLRAFFAALTKTGLNFFATNNFLINDTFWLSDGVLKIHSKPDEVLTGSSESDQTYKDWVHITWHTKRRDEWAIYDNVNGAYGELWMKDMIWGVIHSMDFSDIEP